jgi:starvation-inducible outer membrane lipoprotein
MFPTFGRLILLSLSLVVSGCTGIIPSELREKIQWDVGLRNLQQEPKAHKGQLVVLGGEILDVKSTVSGEFVEVLQRPLNASTRPNLVGESQGRFLIKLTKEIPLDKDYREGQPLTVVGDVMEDAQGRPGKDIPSPILVAQYLHLWSARDYARRTPPPYYYDDPFFHRRLFLRHRW